jgi:2,3-bisphosphoglycerate-independent phosphoglycerate mutase
LPRKKVAQEAFAKARGHRLHLLGLVSEGGVHSHYRHLLALAEAAHAAGVKEIFVHAFTDGRDASPTGGADILRECEKALARSGAQSSQSSAAILQWIVIGAGDRTKKAWDAIVHGQGEQTTESPADAVAEKYREGKTDEFMPAMIFSHAGEERVRDDDVVLFFKFPRRPRAPAFAGVFVREFRWFRSRKVAASSFRNPYSI